jgi:hypothetical protein
MKEQSHKEEMSAALRGDFQRLRERGVAPSLVPQDTEEPDAAPPEPVAEDPADDEPSDVPAESPPVRRGWLSRLAGR